MKKERKERRREKERQIRRIKIKGGDQDEEGRKMNIREIKG